MAFVDNRDSLVICVGCQISTTEQDMKGWVMHSNVAEEKRKQPKTKLKQNVILNSDEEYYFLNENIKTQDMQFRLTDISLAI